MNFQRFLSERQQPIFFVVFMLVFLIVGGSVQPVFAKEAAETGKGVSNFFEALQVNQFDEQIEAPDFSLPLVNGEETRLSDYKGKIVLLNFWATWCPYCRTERAALQATYEKYKDQAFVILSVSIDQVGIEVVKKFVEENNITFPNAHDKTSKVAAEYDVPGVPVTFFIDTDGQFLGSAIGPRAWDSEEAHGLVEQMLKAASAS